MKIIESDFEKACRKMKSTVHIDYDLALSEDLNSILRPDEARKMTFILVVLCQKGTARYNVDTHDQMVEKNDIVIISERHVVNNFEASEDFHGLCMFMSVNFFYEAMRDVKDLSSLFLFSKNYPHVKLTDQEAEVFADYFFLLKKKAANHKNHFRREVAQALFMAMFYDLSAVIYRVQETSKGKNKRAQELFTRFINLVEENYKHERRVGWYSETLGITPKHLSETVKEISKRTPNEWIDSCVTLELRLLLRNTDKSIKEIAEETGFASQSFLGKYFKEHVGMSPSEYRKS